MRTTYDHARVPSGKGVVGAWDQLIVAEWSVLELPINAYASFEGAVTSIWAMYTVDVGVRVAGAFSATSSLA